MHLRHFRSSESLVAWSARRAQNPTSGGGPALEALGSSISHDLRASVRHINGFLLLLVQSLGDDVQLDEQQRKYIGFLERVVAQMGERIMALSDFARTLGETGPVSDLFVSELIEATRADLDDVVSARALEFATARDCGARAVETGPKVPTAKRSEMRPAAAPRLRAPPRR